ncbi:hypothetical protein BBP40_008533 [Aspergillus hancockii]|nr:hypothetical protein BBP40_008533 [Aspergillus hancockii]
MDSGSEFTGEATRAGKVGNIINTMSMSNPALVGNVCIDNDDSLEELLILSHTSVPQQDLVGFLRTGVPPKEYVFVSFTSPSQGNSLIHERDLDLVDRPLILGETVKRHPDDTISGTVISTSAKCSLEPIAYRTRDPETGENGPLKFTDKAVKRGKSPAVEDNGSGPLLLYEVPISELKGYEEFSEGDYIIYRQNLGRINEIERDNILLLPNQKIVSPIDPGALEAPLPFNHDSLVAMPSNTDAMQSYPLADGGTIWSVESEFMFPGQFCFTSRNNLSFGEWSSRVDADSEPEGYVIATPALDVHIDWLCPNVFAVGTAYSRTSTDVIRASTLRGNAVKCDFRQAPQGNSDIKPVQSDTWLGIGDRVRFRDPIAAAAKYPAYQNIPTNQSFGCDMNILRITSTKTEVTVQWQDSTITTEAATTLHRFSGAEEEVWPGGLVTLKDGIETVREPCSHTTGPLGRHMKETICVKNVGVVQSVDSRERITSVRWYENPDIKLTHPGNILIPGSSLGKLGDTATDVSIYELSSYPSMQRAPGDVVLLVPEKVHQSLIPLTDSEPTGAAGPCQLSFLSPMSFFETFVYLESMKTAMVNSEWFKQTTEIDTSPVPSRYSVHHDVFNVKSGMNFVGKIVSMDTNGITTVRLAGTDNCRDVSVPWERIMMVIDQEDTMPLVPIPPFDVLNFTGPNPFDQSRNFSVAETIEYEGGERLDDDSGDEGWTTEYESEIDDEDIENIIEDDIVDSDGFTAQAVSAIRTPEKLVSYHREQPGTIEAQSRVSQEQGSLLILSSPLPSSCPPGFSLLEGPPPSDHHFLSKVLLGAGGLCTKRIQKEFEILRSSLPPEIFVRTWESRMDLLRVLILGPQGTPYERAPFVIDFRFPDDYPTRPPAAFFHSWTNRNEMINPNLEENGNICLSLLGTWPGKNPTESWSPNSSTVLQVIVSIMGLVLVKTPFYNEAGYEALAAGDHKNVESTQYTEKTFLLTRKFIQHALENPIAGLEDVLAWHYLADPRQEENTCNRPRLLRRAIDEALYMIEHHNRTSAGKKLSEEHAASAFVSRLSLGAVVMLRKHVTALEQIESAANARGNI